MVLLLLPVVFSFVSAFSWSSSPQKSRSVFSELTGEDDHSLNQEEMNAVFLNPYSLESHTRKPECFRRAAGYMRVQCSELDLDEDQRVRIAISMTLCELATAKNHSPPMECRSFARDFSDTSQGTRDCVEALSRSAQFWSSYSGYLRETTQLCFTLQRWHNVDTAKAIYYNATLEKVALLNLMVDREKRSSERSRQMNELLEVMGDVLIRLRESSENINTATDGAAAFVQGHLQKTTGELVSMLSDIQKRSEEDRSAITLQVQSKVDSMLASHERSLVSVATSFEAALQHQLDHTFNFVLEHNEISHLTDAVQDARIAFSADVVTIRESLAQVFDHVNHVSDLLRVQSDLALSTQHSQSAAALSAENFLNVVTQLTATTRLELTSINDTATAIRENLIVGNQLNFWLSGPVLSNIISAVLNVDLSRFEHLFQHSMFRVIAVIARLFGTVLYILISAMMSAFFFSSRKWIPHRTAFPSASKMASVDSAPSPQHVYPHSDLSTQCISQTRSRFRPRVSRIPDRLLRQPVLTDI